MERIGIVVSRHSAFYSPLISAVASGFLAEEGLEASYDVATPERPAAWAVAEGRAQVAQSAVSQAWAALERGEHPAIRHFAQINERDGFVIAGREPDPRFTWARLEGREILVDHGGQPLAMFRYAAHRMGIEWARLGVADAGPPERMIEAFRGGRGNYVHLQGPAPQALELEGTAHVIASVGEAIGPVAFSSLMARTDWLITSQAVAFMRAYRRALAHVNAATAAEIARAEAKFFPAVPVAALERAIAFYQGLGCWNRDPRIRPDLYEAALNVFVHAGTVHQRHAFSDVVAAPPDEA